MKITSLFTRLAKRQTTASRIARCMAIAALTLFGANAVRAANYLVDGAWTQNFTLQNGDVLELTTTQQPSGHNIWVAGQNVQIIQTGGTAYNNLSITVHSGASVTLEDVKLGTNASLSGQGGDITVVDLNVNPASRVVLQGSTLTFDGANNEFVVRVASPNSGLVGMAGAKLVADGGNSYPGIEVIETAELTIDGDPTAEIIASASDRHAAIGGVGGLDGT